MLEIYIIDRQTDRQADRQALGTTGKKYLHQLSLRSTDECGNSNSSQFKTYWKERLSVHLQRCNSRVIYRKVEGLLDRGDE